MTNYIDPNQPDSEIASRVRSRIAKDKEDADDLARRMLFGSRSTYNGSPEALKRMASKAGRPLPSEDT